MFGRMEIDRLNLAMTSDAGPVTRAARTAMIGGDSGQRRRGDKWPCYRFVKGRYRGAYQAGIGRLQVTDPAGGLARVVYGDAKRRRLDLWRMSTGHDDPSNQIGFARP